MRKRRYRIRFYRCFKTKVRKNIITFFTHFIQTTFCLGIWLHLFLLWFWINGICVLAFCLYRYQMTVPKISSYIIYWNKNLNLSLSRNCSRWDKSLYSTENLLALSIFALLGFQIAKRNININTYAINHKHWKIW